MYAVEVSPEFISKVTDAVMAEVCIFHTKPGPDSTHVGLRFHGMPG
jgi:transposase-like protein